MKDTIFLLLTLAAAILLAIGSVVVQLEILHDPALLVMLALGGGLAAWSLMEDQADPGSRQDS